MEVIICLCDGSSIGNPGPSTIAVVIWHRIPNTSSARKLKPDKEWSKKIGTATNNDAEWQAVIAAIRYCEYHANASGDEEIYIYSDSRLVVNQINGLWKANNLKMGKYLVKYRSHCQYLKKVTVAWLPRQLTFLADELT